MINKILQAAIATVIGIMVAITLLVLSLVMQHHPEWLAYLIIGITVAGLSTWAAKEIWKEWIE